MAWNYFATKAPRHEGREHKSVRSFDQDNVAPVHYTLSGKAHAPMAAFVAKLRRRGVELGAIYQEARASTVQKRKISAGRLAYYRALWNRPRPFVIERALSDKLPRFQKEIRQSLSLLGRIRASGSAAEWLEAEPYANRLNGRFDIVCAITDLGDPREIQKIYLNAVAGEKVLAQDLFIKVNHLSLYEKDASIRLRFSFGEEAFRSWRVWERDQERSGWSTELALAIFPESRLITHNTALTATLEKIIGHPVEFPERIIYSNTPEGGAFFHHDYVRSHAGVIFAQLHGVTGWLVLPKTELVASIKTFLTTAQFQCSLKRQFPSTKKRAYLDMLAADNKRLADELECDEAESLAELVNNNAEFIGYLVQQGAMRILRPGDVILLPAPQHRTATWHSVFCLDDRPGLSLSFAIKRTKLDSRRGCKAM